MSSRRAFTQVELVAVLGVAATCIVLLSILQTRSRSASQLALSTANLQSMGAHFMSYAADYQDQTAVLSWRGGVLPPSQWPDLQYYALSGTGTPDAASAQAIDIIRRRSTQSNFPFVPNWLPYLLFNHLVLVDYAAQSLPQLDMVSPADSATLQLARNPEPGDRNAFGSSYEYHPFLWQPERRTGSQFLGVTQADRHYEFRMASGSAPYLGPRSVASIAYPSQKAILYDRAQRHFGADIYFAIPQARTLVLSGDCNVSVRAAANCNVGFNPSTPSRSFPTSYLYQPRANEPPVPGGNYQVTVSGLLRWTRGGLQGRDFDGAEISTSNW